GALLRLLHPDALVHGERQGAACSRPGDDVRAATMRTLLAALLFAPAALFAAQTGHPLDPAPIDPRDLVSLQSGARTFVNYCMGCHGLQYMRYNRLTDLGLTEAQIRDNLMFSAEKSR